MPACRCRSKTTRVASISDWSLGRAASQSGTGYEPTVVVRIPGEPARAPVIDSVRRSASATGAPFRSLLSCAAVMNSNTSRVSLTSTGTRPVWKNSATSATSGSVPAAPVVLAVPFSPVMVINGCEASAFGNPR